MRRCTTLRFVLTDHPWKIDPIQADRSYTPWDRRLDKVKAMISRLQYAVGVTARKSSTSLVSPIQDDHAALTQDKAAMTTGQDNATANTDLIAMKTGFQTPESFSINTDQIIGGHTEAFVDATEDDTFLFHGTLRVTRDPLRMSTAIGFDTITDEHVGFATMEYDFPGFYRIESRTARAFEVRVRGSGHPFFMKFQTSWGKDFQYFAHMFVPTDEWRNYILRFDHFRNIMRGCEQRGGQDPATASQKRGNMNRIGFGVNCGEEDDFWLEIEYVRFVLMTVEETSDGHFIEGLNELGEHYRYIPKNGEFMKTEVQKHASNQ